MNNGNQALQFLYLFGVLILVVSAFSVRRVPIAQSAKMASAWILIFAAVFAVILLKDDFIDLGQHLAGRARGDPIVDASGKSVRIPRSDDGHFWVTARINGVPVRFLIDSGATVTALSRSAAEAADIEPDSDIPVLVETANGAVQARTATAKLLELGSIKRKDFAVHIQGSDETNLLGMNFLSSLSGFRVEGNTLILNAE